ncbi:MAG: putative toxin-antitoxin system toxin component, PIN family [Acidimicrobiales bacterium]
MLDPNVLVSAALSSNGPSAQVLAEAREGSFELVAWALLDELGRVLRRERFRSYLSIEDSVRYVEAIGRLATSVANPTQVPSATRDRDDDYLVALLGSSADLLVSGDKDLTDLDDARIVSPRAAIEILRAAGQ